MLVTEHNLKTAPKWLIASKSRQRAIYRLVNLILYSSLVVYPAGAYPSSLNVKQLGVLQLPPEWDVSPLQGYPPAFHLAFWTVTPTHCPSKVLNLDLWTQSSVYWLLDYCLSTLTLKIPEVTNMLLIPMISIHF